METQTQETANGVNGLENGSDTLGSQTRAPEAVFLKRRRRRRLDLRTLAGTLRESARVYRDIAEGKITLGEGEVRSRVLGRHKDILSSIEQVQQLKDLNQKLEALNSKPGEVEFLPAVPSDSKEGGG